jgi:hypothetical protein
MFQEGKGGYRESLGDYQDIAISQGLDPSRAVQDVGPRVPLTSPRPQGRPGEQQAAPTALPAVPQGVDPNLWPDLFNAMPPDQQALFQ